MKFRFIKDSALTVLAFFLIVGMPALTFADMITSSDSANNTPTQTCSVATLTSGGGTQTAGYTETNPQTGALAMQPAEYSGGSFNAATLTQAVVPPWLDPSNSSFAPSYGAEWLSTNATWPGGDNNTEGSPANDQWRLFQENFTLPADATVTSAQISYSADNAAAVYLNGSPTAISTTNASTSEDVYGPAPASDPANFGQVFTTNFVPTAGSNTLDFVVRNWSTTATTNPTGLLYKATINYCVPAASVTPPTNPGTVTVTINKFIDGSQATMNSANSADFPMVSTTTASNLNSGNQMSGDYELNTADSYQAVTSDMAVGANYATNEITDGSVVGTSCDTTQPFSLVGYSSGDTLAAAMSATATTTAPSFTNLTNNKYVIVWNHDCSGPAVGDINGTVNGGSSGQGTLAVTSIAPVDTQATADNSFADGWSYTFNITVPSNQTNLSMKFADWVNNNASSTIPAGNNMQISSAQADNAGAEVPITAANTYSTPALHLTGDLDPSTPGNQVQVIVQTKIPVNSVNGGYTTDYGIQTLP